MPAAQSHLVLSETGSQRSQGLRSGSGQLRSKNTSAPQQGLAHLHMETFLLRNKDPGDRSCRQGPRPSPPRGASRAVQGPVLGGGARLECDSLALRDALLAKCDSPGPLSPPKASASTPPAPPDHQIKELRATAEAAKPGREVWGGARRTVGSCPKAPPPCRSPSSLLGPPPWPCPDL